VNSYNGRLDFILAPITTVTIIVQLDVIMYTGGVLVLSRTML